MCFLCHVFYTGLPQVCCNGFILQGQIYFYSPLAQSVMKIMSKTKKTIQKSSMMSLLKLTGSSIYERNKAVSESKNW